MCSCHFLFAVSVGHFLAIQGVIPNPVSRREAMSCPRLKDEHWIAAPTIMMLEPMIIVRLRPKRLPSQIVAQAPMKQPRV